MNAIDIRLECESKAHRWGYDNEVLIALSADLLQGAISLTEKVAAIMPSLPAGIHVSRRLREIFFNMGREIATSKSNLSDESLQCRLAELMHDFTAEVSAAIKENSILASTGDCRGACKYNTGDSSEYRNYGW